MRKLFIIVLIMIFLVSLSVNAIVVSNTIFDITDTETRLFGINWTDTTAFIDYHLNTTHCGYDYSCYEDSSGVSIKPCWTDSGGASIDSTYGHSGHTSIKINEGVGTALVYNPTDTDKNFSMSLWISNAMITFPDRGTGIRLEGDSGSRRFTVGETANTWELRDAGGTTTSNVPYTGNPNEWMWAKLDPGTGFNCLTTNATTNAYDCKVPNQIINYVNSFHIGEAGTDVIHYVDDILIWETGSPVNTTKNNIRMNPINSDSFDTVKFTFTGTDVLLNFSCDNGSTWQDISVSGNDLACNIAESNVLESNVILTTGLGEVTYFDIELSTIDVTPPTITVHNPENLTGTNQIPLLINFTVTDDATVECNLTNSSTVIDTYNGGSATTQLTYTNALDEYNNVSLSLICADTTGNTYQENLLITIDTRTPIITITDPTNETAYHTSLPIDISCIDDNVQRLNYTITNSSDDIITSVESQSIIGNEITMTDPVDISLYTIGVFNLDIECADSHTKKNIKDYVTIKDKSSKKQRYITDLGKVIDIINLNDKYKDHLTWKDKDRYKFKFEFDQHESVYIFKVISQEALTYLPDSIYPGHFITNHNWIDFNLIGDDQATYLIQKIDDYEYQISITTILTDLEFSSIGDLNTAYDHYEFNVTTVPETPTSEADDLVAGIPLGGIAQITGMVFLLFMIFGLLKFNKK